MRRELERWDDPRGAGAPAGAVLGGAKVSDKIALVEHLLSKVDALLIGGGMAFTFLRALGHDVGKSLVEPTASRWRAPRWRRRAARRADRAAGRRRGGRRARQPSGARCRSARFRPSDGARPRPAQRRALRDTSAARQDDRVERPMGVFEKPPFAAGTVGCGARVVGGRRSPVIGGGDTIAAVNQAGVADRIGYISTAGGAFLEFLEGRALPGVEALTEA
jgi:phosphoglycerate kinase